MSTSEDSVLPFLGSSSGTGMGSGFIITNNGYIVTNAHVVLDEKTGKKMQLKVILGELEEEYEGKIIGADQKTDIAVVKIEKTGLPTLEFANSDQVKPGEPVFVIGNPVDVALSRSITKGIVSGVKRAISYNNDSIQIDAAVNGGNSGGPALDGNGRVIGVVNSKISGTNNLGFAIASKTAQSVSNDITKNGHVTNRAALGVQIYSVTAYDAQRYQVPQGLCIKKFFDGSKLPEAGLKTGDIITKLNGIDATNTKAFYDELKNRSPGDTVKLEVYRRQEQSSMFGSSGGGKTFEANVTLVEDTGDTTSSDAPQ
jgi:serine protease Do